VSVKELAKVNRMSARGELRKGQTVKIPKAVRAGRGRSVGRYRTEQVSRKHHRGGSPRERSSRGRSLRGHSSRRHR